MSMQMLVFDAQNELIDRVLYDPVQKKVVYITQKEPWECFGQKNYKIRTAYLLEGNIGKQLYQTRDPGDSCFNGEGIGDVWFMENPNYVAVRIGGYEWGDLMILNIKTGKNILKGYDIEVHGTVWSQDKQVLIVQSFLNEFSGGGGEALFVSDYGNPENLNEVIRIPNEKFLEQEIENITFAGNDKVTFTLLHEGGETKYEYLVIREQLNEIR
jgi:hypothetical protein